MITSEQKNLLLEKIVELLELPDPVYQKAKERYENLGEYFSRKLSSCHDYDPHIFPQGSFRLGTAIKPLDEDGNYDLDLACNLSKGISKYTHTQADLKELIGTEIEGYRIERNIKAPVKKKHRCWRIEYADHLSFHIDIVPCIPENTDRQNLLIEAMVAKGRNRALSEDVTHHAVSITDDRRPDYSQLSDDWYISNPEGYAQWFESRMQVGPTIFMEKAQVDDLPIYERKTPLQRSIQILKRHRDHMFKDDPDVKPVSIIITTIAADAYSGQSSLELSLKAILDELVRFSASGSSEVLNPVNPNENFADRWSMPKYKHLGLQENFSAWVKQAQIDFSNLVSSSDMNFIAEHALRKLSVRPIPSELAKILGLTLVTATHQVKSHEIQDSVSKPWSFK